MNRRDTELLAMPTVPAMRGRTSAYLRVETPRCGCACPVAARLQPLVDPNGHFLVASRSAAKAWPLQRKLPLGQDDPSRVAAMPEDFSHPPTRMLGPSEFLRRVHQELLDKPGCGIAHQLVDARARVLDELQHWQQHLALVGKAAPRQRWRLCPTTASRDFLPARFPVRSFMAVFLSLRFTGWQTRSSRIHQENRRPQPYRRDTSVASQPIVIA
jgi:hypothetical protein